MNFSEARTNISEERLVRVGITGASTSDPTRRVGPGVVVTRTAVGVVRITFTDNPGTFVGISGPTFGAVTPSGVKGYSISRGAYVAPASGARGYIEVSLWDASNAAVDLTSVQYLDLTVLFAAQTVIK